MVVSTFNALWVVSAICSNVAILLAVLALRDLAFFMRFFYFYFCVKQSSDGEDIAVTSLWIEVGEEHGEWYFCLGVFNINHVSDRVSYLFNC